MEIEKPIVLTGPMGAGKTSTGYGLSRTLKCDFYDTDNEMVERMGVSISHIFDVEGETSFRQRETKLLKELCRLKHLVIATGGGVIIRAENRRLLKRCATVIYLQSSVQSLLSRIAQSDHRPLLTNSSNKAQTMTDILKVREPWYLECANIIINTSDKKLYTIINEIKKQLI